MDKWTKHSKHDINVYGIDCIDNIFYNYVLVMGTFGNPLVSVSVWGLGWLSGISFLSGGDEGVGFCGCFGLSVILQLIMNVEYNEC